jgi:hypothetical protein
MSADQIRADARPTAPIVPQYATEPTVKELIRDGNWVIERFRAMARDQRRDVLCYPYRNRSGRIGRCVVVCHDGAIYAIGDRVSWSVVRPDGGDGVAHGTIVSLAPSLRGAFGVVARVKPDDGGPTRRLEPVAFGHFC